MPPLGRRFARRLISFAVIVVAIVVVVLVALIAEGVLVLPSNSPAPVTISSVHLEISQGTTLSGVPWLGPSSIYYNSTNSNYPLPVAPGGSWSVVWTFINFDTKAHNITEVSPHSPFTFGGTLPPLPYAIAAGEDNGALSMTIIAPSTPGDTYAVTVVVYVGTGP